MGVDVIQPITITEDILLGSNLIENDAAEWVSGIEYSAGDIRMVSTSVSNVHKIFECLNDQTNGLAADLLDEDCSGISDWTSRDSNTGQSKVYPSGKFEFYSGSSSRYVTYNRGRVGTNNQVTQLVWGIAGRQRVISAPPDTFTIDLKLYFDKLGTYLDSDRACLLYESATWQFAVYFCSDGLYILKAGGVAGLIGNIVKCNSGAAWQSWRFYVSKAVESTATVEVWLKEEGEAWVSQGTFDCDYEVTASSGRIYFGLEGMNTSKLKCHMDYIRAATGNGGITTSKSPNNNTDWLQTASTNKWGAFDKKLSSKTVTGDTLQYLLHPGESINSVAFLSIEDIESIKITEINDDENEIVNPEFADASGTTPPTGWLSIGDVEGPTFSVSNEWLQIIAGEAFLYEGVRQTFSVTPETDYLFVFVSKSATASDTPYYRIYDATHSTDIIAVTEAETNGDYNWGCIQKVEFTIPAGCTSILIDLLAGQGQTVSFYSPKMCKVEYTNIVSIDSYGKTDIVETDILEFDNCSLLLEFDGVVDSGSGVHVGEIIIGNNTNIGTILYSPTVSITDYSKKSQDEFGDWIILEREYSKNLTCEMLISNSDLLSTFEFLESVRPESNEDFMVWIGHEDYSCMIVYGFCRDFNIVMQWPDYSLVNLEIEGVVEE